MQNMNNPRLVNVVDRVLKGELTPVQLRYWLGVLNISAEDFLEICRIRGDVLAKKYAQEKVNTISNYIGLVIFLIGIGAAILTILLR